jgi:hypothetical protein
MPSWPTDWIILWSPVVSRMLASSYWWPYRLRCSALASLVWREGCTVQHISQISLLYWIAARGNYQVLGLPTHDDMADVPGKPRYVWGTGIDLISCDWFARLFFCFDEALNNVFHDTANPIANGWKMGRYRFFLIVFVVSMIMQLVGLDRFSPIIDQLQLFSFLVALRIIFRISRCRSFILGDVQLDDMDQTW